MLGKVEEGSRIYDAVAQNSIEYLEWYLSLSDKRLVNASEECMYHLYMLTDVVESYEKVDKKKAEKYSRLLEDYEQRCYERGVRM